MGECTSSEKKKKTELHRSRGAPRRMPHTASATAPRSLQRAGCKWQEFTRKKKTAPRLEVRLAAIEADGLDGASCAQQDGAAGRLVHAARLHAHKTAGGQELEGVRSWRQRHWLPCMRERAARMLTAAGPLPQPLGRPQAHAPALHNIHTADACRRVARRVWVGLGQGRAGRKQLRPQQPPPQLVRLACARKQQRLLLRRVPARPARSLPPTVLATQPVQLSQQRGRRHAHAVDGHGVALR